jgi:hypothetical protein
LLVAHRLTILKERRLTRSNDLCELLELLGADLDVADFEQTGEKLREHVGQLTVLFVAWSGTICPQCFGTYFRLGFRVPDYRHDVDLEKCWVG